jgi:hypothetical protein
MTKETTTDDVAATVDQLVSQLKDLRGQVPAAKQHAIDTAIGVINAVRTEAQARIGAVKAEVEAEKAKVSGARGGA